MRSHIFRTLCLAAGFGALFAACGGGEETRGILAVAFRLDEGTPVMAAYAGDPEEDPFVLPAGRYYIETLDQDDVVTSLGSVDIEGGAAVSFPASVSESGGTPDAEAAAPLLTIANFLIDTQLAEYAFLEIVTGGFELSPYDPGIEVSPEDVIALFEAYGVILDQKDAVLAALGEVEGRADVSAPLQRLSPQWAPSRQTFSDPREYFTGVFLKLADDDPYGKADMLKEFADIVRRKREAEIALIEESAWIVNWNESSDTRLGKVPGLVLPKVPDLVTRHGAWEDFAKELVGTIEDEASAQRAQARLKNRITDDYAEYMSEAGFGPWPADGDIIVDYFVTEVFTAALGPAAALAGVSATPTGGAESSTPTPDTSWVEPYVESISDGWRGMGFEESAVVASANNLRACLLAAVEMGLDDEESATALCPYEGFEPGTPTPEQTAAPTPEPTEEPTATPGLRTARGKFTFVAPGQTDTENTMTLAWNSTGGPITFGEGRRRTEWSAPCGTEWSSFSRQYTGTYDPGSKTFSGTYSGTGAVHYWYLDTEGKCAEDNRSGIPDSGPWGAAWEDSVVRSTAGSDFSLTVEGQ